MRALELSKYAGQLIYLDTAGMGYVGVLKHFQGTISEMSPIAVLEPAQLVPHNEGVGSIYRTLLGRTKFEEEYSGRADVPLEHIIGVFTMPREKKE